MSHGFVHFPLVELCCGVMLKHVIGSFFAHVCRKVASGGYNAVGSNDSRGLLGVWSSSVVGINDFLPRRVLRGHPIQPEKSCARIVAPGLIWGVDCPFQGSPWAPGRFLLWELMIFDHRGCSVATPSSPKEVVPELLRPD